MELQEVFRDAVSIPSWMILKDGLYKKVEGNWQYYLTGCPMLGGGCAGILLVTRGFPACRRGAISFFIWIIINGLCRHNWVTFGTRLVVVLLPHAGFSPLSFLRSSIFVEFCSPLTNRNKSVLSAVMVEKTKCIQYIHGEAWTGFLRLCVAPRIPVIPIMEVHSIEPHILDDYLDD